MQAECYIGEIRIFAGNFAPKGWELCDGRLLPIAEVKNQPLFTVLGTMYGGDGRGTFALPDLRGRVVVGFGQGPGLSHYQQGDSGGAERHHLTSEQMPKHSHSVHAAETATTGDPKDAVLAKTTGAHVYGAKPDSTTMHGSMIGVTGGAHPVSVVQPFLALNYIIALEGMYPSRE